MEPKRRFAGSADDEAVIRLIRARDEKGIALLAEKYGGYLRSAAMNILHNEPDCEECLNDVYLAVWNSLPEGDIGSLRAFAAAVTRNLAHKKFRCAARIESAESLSAFDELFESVATGASAEEEFLTQETAGAISAFLRTLAAEKRHEFIARYYDLRPAADIASELGKTVSALNESLAKTRKKLKEYLERNGIEL